MRPCGKLTSLFTCDQLHVIHTDTIYSKFKRVEIARAQQEEQIKKDVDNAKVAYAEKLRRKLALKAMLSLLNVRPFVLRLGNQFDGLENLFCICRRNMSILKWWWRMIKLSSELR